MSTAITFSHDVTENENAIDWKSPIGTWEIHSWGDGKLPGMAAVSAIATLQIGATLTPSHADKVALNKAVEYLMSALESQLKSFQQTLTSG